MSNGYFRFKQFMVRHDLCAMKVGTDGVLLGAWAEGGNRILDIGTGSGLIALMMAQRHAHAQIAAIDIDHDAACQARLNVAGSPFADRIDVWEASLQTFASQHAESSSFDSIVSNPPYFTNGLRNPDRQRSVARHTDTLPFRELFQGVSLLLAADGVFCLITPTECLSEMEAEASLSGLFLHKQTSIRTTLGKAAKRHLVAFRKTPATPSELREELLQDGQGHRSEWYQELTKDFYL